MSRLNSLRNFVFAVALLISVLAAHGGENMIGRQSQNEGMLVLPVPGKVTVDGDLSDWDLSGRIWVFADISLRNRYSVEASAMYDAENLYLAAKWRDPTPMFNTIDPQFNPDEGWKSDSWQVRIRTDKISNVTTWYFTPKKMPVLHVQYGKGLTQAQGGPGTFVVFSENGSRLGRGIEMAYREGGDGQSYIQEIKLPWSILCDDVKQVRAGWKLQIGHEFLWGDPTGKTWPIHRYADNMQAGVTSREFYWTNWRAWGDAVLAAGGNVPVRNYVSDEGRVKGTVPVRASIPTKAARFTLAINRADGRRVRNLAGDLLPEDYTAETHGDQRVVEVLWDCLDDNGRLVQPGPYKAVGLSHEGLAGEYECCFYNPGTPPWDTAGGSGAWGADHTAPSAVTAGADWTFVTWSVAEGGHGIIGIGPDGLKKWGERRGITAVAADEKYVSAYVAHWYVQKAICRFEAKTGKYAPFVLDGTKRPFDLPLTDILGEGDHGNVEGMSVHDGKLALSLSSNRIVMLDATSAKVLKSLEVARPGGVAFSKDGVLFAIADGRIVRVDLEDGSLATAATPGLGKAMALAIDHDGNIVVADGGPDCQVKAFSNDGKLVYTAGRKGGRPIRGDFDEQAMMRVSSIAVDHVGNIWAVESWNYPRRVSVWGRDGKLVRDYVGNTGYAGTGCYFHDDDSTLAYVGPVEIKLDRKKNTWKVSRILWVPGEGEHFEVSTASHTHPQRFRANAQGRMREFLFRPPSYPHLEPYVLFMERPEGWKPVAAVGLVGHLSGSIDRHGKVQQEPSGEFAGLNAYDGFFWNDLNGDGIVRRGECIIVPTDKPPKDRQRGEPGLALGSGWGGRMAKDFTFYANGIVRYAPTGFTEFGSPIYGPGGMHRLGVDDRGDLVPISEENLLLNLSFKNYASPTTGVMGIDIRTERIVWTYPNDYPGVHGSHRAPMAAPGLLIGPLKICGVAYVNENVGRVFQMRGNLGQDYLMTTDGLYVGAMFQDARLPSESLPPKEEQLRGMPMEAFSVGGEPFNGWFGRHEDGKVRTLLGIPRQAAMSVEIKGLDTIRRFAGSEVEISQSLLVRAEQENMERAASVAQPASYDIKRAQTAPVIDGDPKEWRDVPAIQIERKGFPQQGAAKLQYDDRMLYVLFDVADTTPWLNEGKDYRRLFKTGDAVDIQLGANPDAPAKRRDPVAGDVRIVLARLERKPVAVLMQPVKAGAAEADKTTYTSPVMDRRFDSVGLMADAEVAVKTVAGRYRVEAAIPLKSIGLAPKPGMAIRGDVGFISSDTQGMINVARTYWSNKQTNLVNDLPQEAWLSPALWGELKFE